MNLRVDAFAARNGYPVLIVLTTAWCLPLLFGHILWGDEAYSFAMTDHILKTGDWVVPHVAGYPFMEKPPIYYLAGALFAGLTADWLPLADGARLADVFFTIVMVGAALAAGRELYGGRRAWLCAALLLGSVGLWQSFHRLTTDVALETGFAVACCGLILAARRPFVGGLWLGCGAGLGFMAKGLLAPGIFGLVGVLLPLLFSEYRNTNYGKLIGGAVIGVLPWASIWPLALYHTSPELFSLWFWDNNIGRFTGSSGLGPDYKYGFYFGALPWQAWPALPLACWSLYGLGRAGGGWSAATRRLFFLMLAATGLIMLWGARPYAIPLVLWLLWVAWRGTAISLPWRINLVTFAMTLAVLSLASTVMSKYVMPLLVPVALAAPAALEALPHNLGRWLSGASLLLVAVLLVVVWGAWLALQAGIPGPVQPWLGRLGLSSASGGGALALAAAVLVAAAWLWLALRSWQTASLLPLSWAAGLVALAITIAALWQSSLDARMSYRPMIRSMVAALPAEHGCVSSYYISETLRGLVDIYSGIELDDPGATWGGRQHCRYLMLRNDAVGLVDDTWQLLWSGRRSSDHRKKYYLFQRSPDTSPSAAACRFGCDPAGER